MDKEEETYVISPEGDPDIYPLRTEAGLITVISGGDREWQFPHSRAIVNMDGSVTIAQNGDIVGYFKDIGYDGITLG